MFLDELYGGGVISRLTHHSHVWFTSQELGQTLAHYLVVRSGNETVAYGGMWLLVDEAHITTIAVRPEYRGRGFGEMLMIGLIEKATEVGARWVTLEVRVSNTVAQNLYRKYTFHAEGVRKGYYSDNNEDAVIMWSDDIRTPEFQQKFATLKADFERRRREDHRE